MCEVAKTLIHFRELKGTKRSGKERKETLGHKKSPKILVLGLALKRNNPIF